MCFLGGCQLASAGTDCGDCQECTMFGTCPTTFSCSSPTPYCETIEDECVQCLNDDHCSSPTPYCDDDDTYKCFECELDDWVSFGTVSVSPNPYVINTIETVINSIDGVNIDLGNLSATYSQQKRGCCDGPDLIADGSLRADGSVDAEISIVDLKLWPQMSTLTVTANFFGLGSIEVTLEGGLHLTIDTTIGISVGKIYNSCDSDDCISASLNASVSGSLTFSMDAIVCVDSPWSDEHCAGMTVSGTFGDLTLCGSVGCNLDDCTTPACSGEWGAEADIGMQVNIKLIFDSSEYDFPLPYVPIKSADAGVSC